MSDSVLFHTFFPQKFDTTSIDAVRPPSFFFPSTRTFSPQSSTIVSPYALLSSIAAAVAPLAALGRRERIQSCYSFAESRFPSFTMNLIASRLYHSGASPYRIDEQGRQIERAPLPLPLLHQEMSQEQQHQPLSAASQLSGGKTFQRSSRHAT